MGGSQVQTKLILGVDGGGTRCRARLGEPSGAILGKGSGGRRLREKATRSAAPCNWLKPKHYRCSR